MSQTGNHVTSTVATVNKVDILLIENGEKRIAIKPICEALGIDSKAQREKIEKDPILSSVRGLSTSTGSDGKQYEMVTIPFMFVFGWLFTIDPRNVKPEAADAVIKYKLECYKALYDHFTMHANFVETRQKMIDERLAIYDQIQADFASAKEKLMDAKQELKKAREFSFDDFKRDQLQLQLNFEGGNNHEN
jgi:hypothetical protein